MTNLDKPSTIKCLCRSDIITKYLGKLFSIVIIYASKKRSKAPETSL